MTLLGIDPQDFRDARRPGLGGGSVLIGHDLRAHPLMGLDALAQLAESLPGVSIEHHRSDLPPVLPGGNPPQRHGISPGDMVRGIETNGCWLVLWHIEQSPRYRALLDDCLDEIEPHATPGERAETRQGFIFISAPDTVTPVHIDPEHNVLLQLTGTKQVSVGAFADDAMRHREIERVASAGDRNIPAAAVDDRSYLLRPGLGVYVPPFAPHWVRNGPTACVSLSVTWRTGPFLKRERLYQLNARLRRRGLSPSPPGESAVRDNVKYVAARAGWRCGTFRATRRDAADPDADERAGGIRAMVRYPAWPRSKSIVE
jgi:hypothetical protein